MDKQITNDIVFLLEIKSKEDFARVSNFISKVCAHEELSVKETSGILYKRGHRQDELIGTSRWYQNILNRYGNFLEHKEIEKANQVDFRSIQRPEGIKDINDKFKVIYFVIIDQKNLYEIAQYQELLLIMAGYPNACIYTLIRGNDDFYYKLSQYIALVVYKLGLWNRIMVERGENITRLQVRNIRQSTKFLPLILVDRENVERLKDKCINQLGKQMFSDLFSGKIKKYGDIKDKITWNELGGIVMLFLENAKKLKEIDRDGFIKIISGLDVLALAFLTYSMKNFSEDIDIQQLRAYAEIQQQYANACHQLLENILFHSKAGWGILSIRIHETERKTGLVRYLSDNYGMENAGNDYFEVCISDFAGEHQNQNVAECFWTNLEESYQHMFLGIRPINLFKSALGEEDSYAEAWRNYYRRPEYFGKHFGLRIFQRITSESKGMFVAESHKSHVSKGGEIYCYRMPESKREYVLPGTTYGILLPLKKSGLPAVEKDITQEYGDWLGRNPLKLLKMRSCQYPVGIEGGKYDSQQEKNEYIRCIADKLSAYMQERQEEILTIDGLMLKDSEAELWAKGLILASYEMKRRPHFVLYGCTENFISSFKNAMYEMYLMFMGDAFADKNFQIVLISLQGEQTVFLPGNIALTNALNQYISRIKGIRHTIMFENARMEEDMDMVLDNFIPFDVLVGRGEGTFFEEYVLKVLRQNIQEEKFGCQINQTHMRLGSTIHIDKFYEAELMFGSKYFVSRFAFLMLKDMYEDIREKKKLILYGYASYSETLLVTLRNAILALDKEKEVDYILLEREEERRGMQHADRIRYGQNFESEECRKAYTQERDYIVIVPINSTMKTHERLINLLLEENKNIKHKQILRNYALILVGPEKSDYWERAEGRQLKCRYNVKPQPRYFVSVPTEYQESLTCAMCFPEDPIQEYPLIEVNAASTIPNQAFGIVEGKTLDEERLDKKIKEIIKREEDKLQVLKNCMLYGHLERNESHYLYYVKTEELAYHAEKDILASLKEWKKNMPIDWNEYHIIVVPLHYSNCRFVEMVNGEVFQGMAYIIRIDFNKDFRSNAYAKYSNIRQYLQQLVEMNRNVTVKFHYVDDNIVTGRTFFRAKSLVETIVSQYSKEYPRVKIIIFDRVFTLIDRNSAETRMQYLKNDVGLQKVNQYFYTFLRIEISSLRNYGDSCVICNLHREAERLHHSAATGIVSDYWESCNQKFGLITLEDAAKRKEEREKEGKEDKYQERAYRRLICSHIIKTVFAEIDYDNQTMYVAKIFLKLLIENSKSKENTPEEAFEYMISYLKVGSRPFLVFQKPVKEAIYDILLIIIECIISQDSVKNVLERKGMKRYWSDLEREWEAFETLIIAKLNLLQKRDVVLVIMKQLTELKSNYIIRLEKMNALFDFMKEYNNLTTDENKPMWEDFWERYVILVKKLTGISSDTSKSMWLDYALMHRKEMEHDKCIPLSNNVDPLFAQIICLENTRNFQTGIQQIYEKTEKDKEFWEEQIEPYIEYVCQESRINLIMKKYLEYWAETVENPAERQMVDLRWKENLLDHLSSRSAFCPGIAEETFRTVAESGTIWKFAIDYLKMHEPQKPDGIYKKLKETYVMKTEGYQFSNFKCLMKEMNWYQNEEGGYTDAGIDQITCCLVIKWLCEDNEQTEEALLHRMGKIARIVGAMLGNVPVQIWVEYHDSSEYYREVIEEAFEEKRKELGLESEKKLRQGKRKHYHTIGDNTGQVTALDVKVQSLLNQDDILMQLEKYGFYNHECDFLWKIGRRSKYPLYLYSNVPKKTSEGKDAIFMIRNILSLANDVEKSLFAAGKQNYLHEMDLANSRLRVLNREKSYIHTKEQNRIENYERLAASDDRYAHDSLVLLSDLNVSRIYRNSLNLDFYESADAPGSMTWNNQINVLKGEIEEGMHGEIKLGGNIIVEIHNEKFLEDDKPIDEDDELVVPKGREQELMSLLLALILNVKEKDRGVVAKDGKIHVYLSKTKECTMRILNETGNEELILEGIRRCLNQEPVNEDSGITLWSLNCYIKRVIIGYVKEEIQKITDTESWRKALEFANYLTGGEFKINVEVTEVNGKHYFFYELPLFKEKYDKRLDNKY